MPALKWVLLAGTVLGAALIVFGDGNRVRKLAVTGMLLGSLAGIGGSASYAIATATTYELAADTAVMAIGGWSSDPTPTLDQFISYVEKTGRCITCRFSSSE